MTDVFISYSNFDREKAIKLAGKLRANGISVWIDEANLSAASQWSSEIVKGIEGCKVFLILLSHNSFASHNVIKELSLASEEKKHIIPIDLETVELTHEVKYQLAGIQRVPYSEYQRIESAVRRFIDEVPIQSASSISSSSGSKKFIYIVGILVVLAIAIGAYFYFSSSNKVEVSTKGRTIEIKKLVVLPFESLSSNKEDEYFADGLTAQVITTLTGLSGLQVTDRQTAMKYKGKKNDLKALAKELDVRYVVDGTVQKQDKNVKITSELIDVETGKIILSNQFEGTIDDLFGLEEKLARSIAFELQGSLLRQSILDSTLIRQGTKNSEAYNKFLIGVGYLENVQSEAQLNKGLENLEEATKLDPKFAYAQCLRSLAYLAKFQFSGGKSQYLITADSLAVISIKIDPTIAESHYARAQIFRFHNEKDSALHEANLIMQNSPENYGVQAFIGSIYYEKGEFDLAASHLEKAVQKNIIDLSSWSFLIDSYQALGDTVKRNHYIDEALPLYELYLEKNPENVTVRLQYTLCLASKNFKDRAHEQISKALRSTNNDGVNYYNIACAYSVLNEVKPALEMLKKSMDEGYSPGIAITTDPDLKNLRNNPEFKELAKRAMNQVNSSKLHY